MTTRKSDSLRRAPVFFLGAALVLAGCGKSGLDGGHDASSGSSGGSGGTSSSSTLVASGGSSGGQTGKMPHEPARHRPKKPTCVFAPLPEPVNPPSGSACTKHADCTERPHGECVNMSLGSPGRPVPPRFECEYNLCANDSDCLEGSVCDCADGGRGGCVPAEYCRADSECGGGPYSYCSQGYGWDCGSYRPLGNWYCHTPQDTCMDDSDCTGQDYCNYDVVDGRWECKTPNLGCMIG